MGKYIAKCRFQKTLDSGKEKIATEQYLVDGVSVSDTEAVAVKELSPYLTNLEVLSVANSKITEVFGDKESGKFFIAKVAFVSIDERTAEEKKTISQWLIGAEDYDTAKAVLAGEISKCLADMEIIGLAESPIRGYLTYGEK